MPVYGKHTITDGSKTLLYIYAYHGIAERAGYRHAVFEAPSAANINEFYQLIPLIIPDNKETMWVRSGRFILTNRKLHKNLIKNLPKIINSCNYQAVRSQSKTGFLGTLDTDEDVEEELERVFNLMSIVLVEKIKSKRNGLESIPLYMISQDIHEIKYYVLQDSIRKGMQLPQFNTLEQLQQANQLQQILQTPNVSEIKESISSLRAYLFSLSHDLNYNQKKQDLLKKFTQDTLVKIVSLKSQNYQLGFNIEYLASFISNKAITENYQPSKIVASEKIIIPEKSNLQLQLLFNYKEKVTFFYKEKKITNEQSQAASFAIHCLMYIKINISFIAYVYENRENSSVFQNKEDYCNHIIRDNIGTAIYLPPAFDAELFAAYMQYLVEHVEKTIEVATARHRLLELTLRLKNVDTNKCITERLSLLHDFEEKLIESKYLPSLNNLFNQLCSSFDVINLHADAYKKFKPFMHQPFLYLSKEGEEQTIFLSKQYIDQLIESIYGKTLQVERSAAEVNELLDNGALIKQMPLKSLKTYFSEWLDPINQRNLLALNNNAQRNKIFSFKERIWKERKIIKERGLPKPGAFGPKKWTSTLLPPKPGKMTLNFPGLADDDFEFFAILDIDRVNLNGEKYICKVQFEPVKKSYIYNNNSINFDKTPFVTSTCSSLDELRTYLIANVDKVLPLNEILASIPIDAVRGIFCKQNNIASRLKLWTVQQSFKETFGFTLPMFILMPDKGYREYYGEEKQVNDVVVVLKLGNDELMKLLRQLNCFKVETNLKNSTQLDLFSIFIEHDMINHALILGALLDLNDKQIEALLPHFSEKIIESNFYFNKFVNKYHPKLTLQQNLLIVDTQLKTIFSQYTYYSNIFTVLDYHQDKRIFLQFYKDKLESIVCFQPNLHINNIVTILLKLVTLSNDELYKSSIDNGIFKIIFNIVKETAARDDMDMPLSIKYMALLGELSIILIKFNSLQLSPVFTPITLTEISNNIFNKIIYFTEKLSRQSLVGENEINFFIRLQAQSTFYYVMLNIDSFIDSIERGKQKINAFDLQNKMHLYHYRIGGYYFKLNRFTEARYCFDFIYENLSHDINTNLHNIEVLDFINVYIVCLKNILPKQELIPYLNFACDFLIRKSLDKQNNLYTKFKNDLILIYKEKNEPQLLAKLAFESLPYLTNLPSLRLIDHYLNLIHAYEIPYLAKMENICLSLLDKLFNQVKCLINDDDIVVMSQQISSIYKYLSNASSFSNISIVNEFYQLAMSCLPELPSNQEKKYLAVSHIEQLLKLRNTLNLTNSNFMHKFFDPFFYFLDILINKNILVLVMLEGANQISLASLIPQNEKISNSFFHNVQRNIVNNHKRIMLEEGNDSTLLFAKRQK